MDRRILPGLLLAWMLSPAAHAQLPAACAAFPNNCLYTPPSTFPIVGLSASRSYKDATANLRTLDLYVRAPVGPAGALPVVIWSPNADAAGAASQMMVAWNEATAKSGYISVAIAHPRRDNAQRLALCLALDIDPASCVRLNPVNWDWPNDQREVLNWLEEMNKSGPAEIRGRIDLTRIAVAGHADGANAAISLAGALRLLTTDSRTRPDSFRDPRPVAYVALSPQGSNFEGFFDTDLGQPKASWMSVAKPVLVATGSGDNTCRLPSTCRVGDTPSRRRIAYELMPNGSKYLMFVNDAGISHDFLNALDTAGCAAAGVAPARCAGFDQWLRSSVIAFLDANVRGMAQAQAWLQSGLIQPASSNVVGWQSK